MEVIKNLKIGTRAAIKVGNDDFSLLSFVPAVLSQKIKLGYAGQEEERIYFKDMLSKERYMFNRYDDGFAIIPGLTVQTIDDNSLVKMYPVYKSIYFNIGDVMSARLFSGESNEDIKFTRAVSDWLNDGKIDAFKLAKETK